MVTDDPAVPPGFPMEEAEALATRLDRCADLLERAAEARSRAEEDLDDFQCTEADNYRDDLGAYVRRAEDVIERFRRRAGRLRDEVAEIVEQRTSEREEAINRPSR